MSHHHDKSRRKFIGQASCAALGSTTLLSTLTNLKFINAAAAANSSTLVNGDYKAMVCILLSGGSDSHNMLIPTESGQYAQYAATRGDSTTASGVSIPRDQILQLNNSDYGVHPSMSGIQRLYNQNKLSFISNIGTLIQPLTKDEVWNNEQLLPLGLFSHSDQVQQWQTSVPHDRSNIGWGGKIADLMGDMNDNDKISLNISLAGTNVFQTGTSSVEYSLDSQNGAIGISDYKTEVNPEQFESARNKAIDNIIDAQYADVFKRTYIDAVKVSRDAQKEFSEALEAAPDLSAVFSNNELADQLEMIARSIAIRESLGMKRQIFFVEYGGWDHHDELLNSQNVMLSILSSAMEEFQTALDSLGVGDCVTTFTCSEFGRTLTWNGNGTDHAWGGNVMVMGGPVVGGQIHGTYPSLELESEWEAGGGGIMIPTTSCDEYFAELAQWFGVQPSELTTLFPNAGNFFDTQSGEAPIGFMG